MPFQCSVCLLLLKTNIFHRFNTGLITLSSEFDLDDAGKTQEVVTCTVTATDKGGHTVSTQLSITVNEINDNAPLTLSRSVRPSGLR